MRGSRFVLLGAMLVAGVLGGCAAESSDSSDDGSELGTSKAEMIRVDVGATRTNGKAAPPVKPVGGASTLIQPLNEFGGPDPGGPDSDDPDGENPSPVPWNPPQQGANMDPDVVENPSPTPWSVDKQHER